MSIYIFDLLGTFAFALSGALLGVKKDMDIYGFFVLAFVAAVGGGTVRDVLLNSSPFILYDINYLIVILGAVVLVAFFSSHVERVNKYIIIADAVGLGVFAVIGATKGIPAGLSFHGVLLMAVLTGTGGGMIRDIIANEVPIVLTKEIYASACIAGGLLFYALFRAGVPDIYNAVITASLVIFIRLYTLRKNWHLPRHLG